MSIMQKQFTLNIYQKSTQCNVTTVKKTDNQNLGPAIFLLILIYKTISRFVKKIEGNYAERFGFE